VELVNLCTDGARLLICAARDHLLICNQAFELRVTVACRACVPEQMSGEGFGLFESQDVHFGGSRIEVKEGG
jgi:hypothetical protein